MKRMYIYLFLQLVGNFANAEVLFEGYSKVLLGGIHVGYFISRIDYNSSKKQFTSIYFLKTNEFGGNITESLKAVSNDRLEPINYQYTSVSGSDSKTIDAKVQKGKFKATASMNGKKEAIEADIPVGSFFSTFLGYVMLKSPKGLQSGVKYEYQAFAEEDGKLYRGLAFVKELEDYKGLKVFKILNDYKEVKFISYVSEKGEVISTKSPVTSIATELVANPEDATKGFQVNLTNLKMLFGNVPLGRTNALSNYVPQQNQLPVNIEPQDDRGPKASGVPAGKGIFLKGNANPPAPSGGR